MCVYTETEKSIAAREEISRTTPASPRIIIIIIQQGYGHCARIHRTFAQPKPKATARRTSVYHPVIEFNFGTSNIIILSYRVGVDYNRTAASHLPPVYTRRRPTSPYDTVSMPARENSVVSVKHTNRICVLSIPSGDTGSRCTVFFCIKPRPRREKPHGPRNTVRFSTDY